MDPTGHPRGQRVIRESAALALAVAWAVVVAGAVFSSPRAALVFTDADSLVTSLIVRSLQSGAPQDWALSTVLFLPESALMIVLSWVGLTGVDALAVAAVLNLVALYGALRAVSGSPARLRHTRKSALAAFIVFGVLCLCEHSSSRDALEPASLLLTTTYYSATVLAAVLTVGIVRRAFDRHPHRSTFFAMAVAAVAAASVVTNPLFAMWAVVPLCGVLLIVALRTPRPAWILIVALVAGTVVGFALRIPLAHLISNSGVGYADPSRAGASLSYYLALVGDELSHPAGIAAAIVGSLAIVWCAFATVRLARRGARGASIAAACGWLLPLVAVVGGIALGTNAARYLQPLAFAPLLGIAASAVLLPQGARVAGRATTIVLAASAGVSLVVALVVVTPRMAQVAHAPDADLTCVTEWADTSGRTGAGQYWSIRLPKSQVADPRTLVQVDHQLRGYAWLVNRDDFAAETVTFLVVDAQSAPFDIPGVDLADAARIACGRYTIIDLADDPLTIGPQRS